MVLETIRMAPERPRTVSEGPGSAPEVSGMSRNGPGMSRKVLEASRRSWKVLEGSGQYHPLTCAPSLGGKPPRLPWPTKEVGAHQGEGIPSRWKVQLSRSYPYRRAPGKQSHSLPQISPIF